MKKHLALVLSIALMCPTFAPAVYAQDVSVQEFDAIEIIPTECIDGITMGSGLPEPCSTADSTYSEPLPNYAGGPSPGPDPDPTPDPADPTPPPPPPPAPVCSTVTKTKTVNIANGVGGCSCGGTQITTYGETVCDGVVTATNISPFTTTSCAACAPGVTAAQVASFLDCQSYQYDVHYAGAARYSTNGNITFGKTWTYVSNYAECAAFVAGIGGKTPNQMGLASSSVIFNVSFASYGLPNNLTCIGAYSGFRDKNGPDYLSVADALATPRGLALAKKMVQGGGYANNNQAMTAWLTGHGYAFYYKAGQPLTFDLNVSNRNVTIQASKFVSTDAVSLGTGCTTSVCTTAWNTFIAAKYPTTAKPYLCVAGAKVKYEQMIGN